MEIMLMFRLNFVSLAQNQEEMIQVRNLLEKAPVETIAQKVKGE